MMPNFEATQPNLHKGDFTKPTIIYIGNKPLWGQDKISEGVAL